MGEKALILSNKVAIVTGASKGIGRTIALRLAEKGAKIVLAARSKDLLMEVADQIACAGGEALVVLTDMRNPDEVRGMVETSVERFGRLDIMVASAGVTHICPVAEISKRDWDEVLAVNLTGPFLCAQAALRPMLRQKYGRIIFIGSDESVGGSAFMGGYAASKHGLIGLMRSLCMEVGHLGITINTICPGWTNTDMAHSSSEEYRKLIGWTEEQMKEAVLSDTFNRGFADPGEIAVAVVFLASDEARSINGQRLVINAKLF